LFKKSLYPALACFILAAAPLAARADVILQHTYEGGNDHGYGISVGPTQDFGISQAAAGRSGNNLSVAITTNFDGDAVDNSIVTFGDLFLAKTWTPFGTGPAFLQDTYANGTQWQFGVQANGLTDQAAINAQAQAAASGNDTTISGSADLYAITSPSNVILSYVADPNKSCDIEFNCWIWRDGQPVQVATNATTTLDANGNVVGPGVDANGNPLPQTLASVFSTNASWTYTATPDGLDDVLTYTFDASNTGLLIGDDDWDMAMSWAMTCANDIIQGEIGQVPEPSSLALLLAGLVGAGLFVRRRVTARIA